MKVTFLGTGTSQGVPMIGCHCAICSSKDRHDKRLRTSIWIDAPEASIVIDTGPDFRYQMLRANVQKLDAVIFTHSHKDHIAGMDDVRAYNYIQHKPIEVFATLETQEVLKREYDYIFKNPDYPGIPQINFHTIDGDNPFYINGLLITPIRVWHYKMEVLGFRIHDLVYITDVNHIPEEEFKKLKNVSVFILSALRREKHISHFTLDEALEVAERVNAKQTFFTHISHQLGFHNEVEAALPVHVHLGYDGLTINLP